MVWEENVLVFPRYGRPITVLYCKESLISQRRRIPKTIMIGLPIMIPLICGRIDGETIEGASANVWEPSFENADQAGAAEAVIAALRNTNQSTWTEGRYKTKI
jgi:hypothetical protein